MDTARTLLTTLPHCFLQFILLRLEVSHYLHSFFSHLLIHCSIFILPLGTVFSSFYYDWSIFILPLVALNLNHYQSRIPNLQRTPTDELPNSQPNNAKSQLLYKTFFKPAPNVLLTHANEEYPEPPTCFANITNDQISRAIKKLSPYKVPGPNGTCNAVFVNCSKELIPHMGPIFRATFDLKLYLEE